MSLEHELAVAFLESHPRDAALALERMVPVQRAAAVQALPAPATAPALREMVAPDAADCLERLPPASATAILEALGVDAAVPILRRLPPATGDRLLEALPVRTRDAVTRVLRHPPGSAGALMDPTVPALPEDILVSEARVRLRRGSRGLLYYLYVVNRDQQLVGVLDIAELMQARSREPIASVMHRDVERLAAWTPAAALLTHPAWRRFHAMPVVDDAGRLLGAIRYQTLRRLEQEADAATAVQPTGATVAALGELFHLGVAGLIEGVSTMAVRRERGVTASAATQESRDE